MPNKLSYTAQTGPPLGKQQWLTVGGALLCQLRHSGQSLTEEPTDQSDKDDYSTETLFQMITGYVKF